MAHLGVEVYIRVAGPPWDVLGFGHQGVTLVGVAAQTAFLEARSDQGFRVPSGAGSGDPDGKGEFGGMLRFLRLVCLWGGCAPVPVPETKYGVVEW